MTNNFSPLHLRILAGLLATPTAESLAALQTLAEEQPWLQESVQQLSGWPLAEWQAEHTNLFINGYPKTCCPPFESAYREGTMNGPICHDLGHFYHMIGLEPLEGLQPDYLGVLLECAAYLLEQEPVNQEHWETLWQTHLAQWVPRFAADLQRHSQLPLYQQLGLQLQGLF